LRDGDSIYLGRFKGHLATALDEGRRRLSGRLPRIRDADIPKVLKGTAFMPSQEPEFTDDIGENRFTLRARQLVGQPAGSGIANGPARVILHEKDLIDFNTGEIIVCDALEASMTFVIPLASGIVERSGGMLIHGAVIAREYGLPCVTGVPEAMSLIKSGEQITVDGYLGIVIIHNQ
jgi:pyruvate,water dikinase